MRELITVMGIDPGVTTGIASITVPLESLTGSAPSEIVYFEHCEATGSISKQITRIAHWRETLCLGSKLARPIMAVEDFDLDPKKYHSRDKELLAPVRMIGAIEYADECGILGSVIVVLQPLSLSKTDATDDRLKAWGLYTTGSDHVRDATRVAITMIRRLKESARLRKEVWE